VSNPEALGASASFREPNPCPAGAPEVRLAPLQRHARAPLNSGRSGQRLPGGIDARHQDTPDPPALRLSLCRLMGVGRGTQQGGSNLDDLERIPAVLLFAGGGSSEPAWGFLCTKV